MRPSTPRPPGSSPRPPRRLPARQDPLYLLLFVGIIVTSAALLSLTFVPALQTFEAGVQMLRKCLSDEDTSFGGIPRFPERSTIHAADGSVLATIYFNENREIVHLREISRTARRAVLAIEDHEFYRHGAISLTAMVRALVANTVAGRVTQGGSTITQQLIKNVTQERETTVARKCREATLAMQVEREYSKDEILELYMNEVYLGHGIYGLGTASEFYFDRPAKRLSLPQAALLAGMIRSPETYDPIDRPRAAKLRRNEVINRMQELGWIDRPVAHEAKTTPLRLAESAGVRKKVVLPFFARYVRDQVVENADGSFDAFGKTERSRIRTLFQGGLRIYTTLNPAWQAAAQQAANRRLSRTTDPDAAVVTVETRTGAIRTMLSGRHFIRDKKDLVLRGRQPGSAFKPFTLVAAFREGIPPSTMYDKKSPAKLPAWDNDCHCVQNAEGGTSGGFIDLWAATQGSVNVVFAQLVLDVGAANVVEAAHDLGITGPLDAVPSITLGAEEASPLDMASAYATIANDGNHCEPFAIARVRDRRGNLLYRHRQSCEQVLDPDIAHQVTAMLQRVVTGGTGTAAAISRPVAGKTGTAQDYTNAWFVGYTRQLSTAIWVGYPQGQINMTDRLGYTAYGGTLAAPIWHDYMARATAGMPVESFPAPPPPERGPVPDVVGMRAVDASEKLVEANFRPEIDRVPSLEKAGQVIAQAPTGGARADLGTIVRLEVSTGGPPQKMVPNVVGLTGDEARAILRAKGFEVSVTRVDVAQKAKDGIVVAQSPAGGKSTEGSTVSLKVGQHR